MGSHGYRSFSPHSTDEVVILRALAPILVMFQMAEVAVPRQMLHDILRLIVRLRALPAPTT
jgi:hypothetical protein